jgi:hypothetical protein
LTNQLQVEKVVLERFFLCFFWWGVVLAGRYFEIHAQRNVIRATPFTLNSLKQPWIFVSTQNENEHKKKGEINGKKVVLFPSFIREKNDFPPIYR